MEWWVGVEQALHDVPHAVAGAVATNAYAPERFTHDLDVVVLPTDAPAAQGALLTAGWTMNGILVIVPRTTWSNVAGNSLDVIELATPWARDAIIVAQGNRIAGMPTMSMSYLVHMKLMASRTVDLGDVSRMLGRADMVQVTDARTLVKRLGTPDDVADFDQLRRMGQLERYGDMSSL